MCLLPRHGSSLGNRDVVTHDEGLTFGPNDMSHLAAEDDRKRAVRMPMQIEARASGKWA